MTTIDIRIPYLPGGNLGAAYNRAMDTSPDEWVLLLDHDVTLCTHPQWYHVCEQAIANAADDVGMLLCLGTHGSQYQIPAGIKAVTPNNRRCAPIHQHTAFARQIWNEHRYNLTDLSNVEDPRFTGFFMLLRKAAWEHVGGFDEGMFEVDHKFSARLLNNGWRVLRMDGLYVYHHVARRERPFVPDADSSWQQFRDYTRTRVLPGDCKVVLLSANLNGYDEPKPVDPEHIAGMHAYCFTENPDTCPDGWRWVESPSMNGHNPVEVSRYPKILPWCAFREAANADVIIWIDHNRRVIDDLRPLVERFYQSGHDWAVMGHPNAAYEDLYVELESLKRHPRPYLNGKADVIERQIAALKAEGVPHIGTPAVDNALIMRRNTARARFISAEWWAEFMRWRAGRDQVPFRSVCWRHGFEPMMMENSGIMGSLLKHERHKVINQARKRSKQGATACP